MNYYAMMPMEIRGRIREVSQAQAAQDRASLRWQEPQIRKQEAERAQQEVEDGMTWQDILYSICGGLLLIGAVRAVVSGKYPVRSASASTAVGIFGISVATASLGLYASTMMNVAMAVCWAWMAIRGGQK